MPYVPCVPCFPRELSKLYPSRGRVDMLLAVRSCASIASHPPEQKIGQLARERLLVPAPILRIVRESNNDPRAVFPVAGHGFEEHLGTWRVVRADGDRAWDAEGEG